MGRLPDEFRRFGDTLGSESYALSTLGASMAPNLVNLHGLVTPRAPNNLTLHDLVFSWPQFSGLHKV